MNKSKAYSHMDVILALGAIWGLSEGMLGLWLHRCASVYSGAVMTGLAFLYMSFAWSLTRRILPLAILLLMVILFKMLDVVFLSAPFVSGTIANPIFAFFTEVLAFAVIVLILGDRFFSRRNSRLVAGAGSALFATLLFPFVGLFTTVPGCLFPGTSVPQSIVTTPLAIIIALVTVPLGFFLSEKYQQLLPESGMGRRDLLLRSTSTTMHLILCFFIVILNRTL